MYFLLHFQVKLKPRPWLERWERQELKGVQDLGLPERFYKRAAEVARPWEKYDLMKEYRWDTCGGLFQYAAYTWQPVIIIHFVTSVTVLTQENYSM